MEKKLTLNCFILLFLFFFFLLIESKIPILQATTQQTHLKIIESPNLLMKNKIQVNQQDNQNGIRPIPKPRGIRRKPQQIVMVNKAEKQNKVQAYKDQFVNRSKFQKQFGAQEIKRKIQNSFSKYQQHFKIKKKIPVILPKLQSQQKNDKIKQLQITLNSLYLAERNRPLTNDIQSKSLQAHTPFISQQKYKKHFKPVFLSNDIKNQDSWENSLENKIKKQKNLFSSNKRIGKSRRKFNNQNQNKIYVKVQALNNFCMMNYPLTQERKLGSCSLYQIKRKRKFNYTHTYSFIQQIHINQLIKKNQKIQNDMLQEEKNFRKLNQKTSLNKLEQFCLCNRLSNAVQILTENLQQAELMELDCKDFLNLLLMYVKSTLAAYRKLYHLLFLTFEQKQIKEKCQQSLIFFQTKLFKPYSQLQSPLKQLKIAVKFSKKAAQNMPSLHKIQEFIQKVKFITMSGGNSKQFKAKQENLYCQTKTHSLIHLMQKIKDIFILGLGRFITVCLECV